MTRYELFSKKLIGEVKKHEVIYNNAHRIDHSKRHQAWTQISNNLGVAVQQCKTRWSGLRVRYTLEHSKMVKPNYRKRWKHFDEMAFMNDFVGPNSSDNFLQRLAIMSKRDLFCRACLRPFVKDFKQSSNSYHIFDTEDVVEKLITCTNLQIDRSDKYPHSLCEKCYKQLLDFYQFQCMCRDSLEKFNIMLDNQLTSKLSNDEDEISDDILNNLIEFDGNSYELQPEQLDENSRDVDYLNEMSSDNMTGNNHENYIVDPLEENEDLRQCNNENYFSEEKDSNVENPNNKMDKCEESDDNAIDVNCESKKLLDCKTMKLEKHRLDEEEEDQEDNNNEIAEDMSDEKSELKTTKTRNKYRLKCDICPQSFRYQHRLEAHQRRHQGLSGYLCTYENCERAFNRLDDLRKHLDEHNGIKKEYKCDIEYCCEVYTSSSGLNLHKRTRHNIGKAINKTFECDICHTILKSRETLRGHHYIHMDKSEWPFACDVEGCKVRFRLKKQMIIHLKRHAGIKKYICPHCGMRKTTSTELNIHVNLHTFEKKYPCSFCPKILKSSGSRSTHIHKVHEGKKTVFKKKGSLDTASEETVNFPCRFCGRKLANPTSLKFHEMTHTGEKPYACKECGKQFVSPIGRHEHMQMHAEGEKLHKCKECGKTFKWISNLTTHRKLHVEGAIPYTCDQCGQGFKWPGSMYTHKKKHHGKQNEAMLSET